MKHRLITQTLFMGAILIAVAAGWKLGANRNASLEHYKKLLLMNQKSLYYSQFSNQRNVIIGDSHVERGRWSAHFCQMFNAGISGETTGHLANRISEINLMQPERILIMSGINDLRKGVPLSEIQSNFLKIVSTLSGEVFILSVLHSDRVAPNKVNILNDYLKSLGVHYIELNDVINKQDLYDGLHLNAQGYLKLASTLNRYFDNHQINLCNDRIDAKTDTGSVSIR